MISIDATPDTYVANYISSNQRLRDNIQFYETGENIIDLQIGAGDIGFFDHVGSEYKTDLLHRYDQAIVAIWTEGLHTIVNDIAIFPKNKKYIFFCPHVWNMDLYQFPFEYTVIECNFFCWDRIFSYFNLYNFNFFTPLQYDFDLPKPYKFYAPIGMRRPERSILVQNIIDNVNFDDFILSYQGKNLGKTDYYRLAIESQKTKMRFDRIGPFAGYEKYYVSLSDMVPIKTMSLAHLTLVVETQINYLGSFFHTEKTIKCVITGTPFVCYANQYHLKNLREKLGFKTYSTLWDESYDDIQDHHERATAIVKLLNQLQNFDWESAKPELLHIAQHNMYNIFQFRNKERLIFIENSNRLKKFLGRE
jgi:hypothetical protein